MVLIECIQEMEIAEEEMFFGHNRIRDCLTLAGEIRKRQNEKMMTKVLAHKHPSNDRLVT